MALFFLLWDRMAGRTGLEPYKEGIATRIVAFVPLKFGRLGTRLFNHLTGEGRAGQTLVALPSCYTLCSTPDKLGRNVCFHAEECYTTVLSISLRK